MVPNVALVCQRYEWLTQGVGSSGVGRPVFNPNFELVPKPGFDLPRF